MMEKSLIITDLQNVKFKEAKIVEGDSKCPFYLDVTYIFENLYGIHELHIPKIRMDSFFHPNRLPDIVHNRYDPTNLLECCCNETMFCLTPNPVFIQGEGNCLLAEQFGTKENKSFYLTTIKEKEREMTLEEVEKTLGHKIKIVAK